MSDLSSVGDSKIEGPGAVLQGLREARGWSVADVALALKLAPRQVQAIETENFESLMGNTFARGFVRNYARILGADPIPLMAALDQRLGGCEVALMPPSNARGEMPVADGRRGISRSLAVLAVAALAGLVVMLAYERYTAAPSAAAPVAAIAQTPAELPVPAAAPPLSGIQAPAVVAPDRHAGSDAPASGPAADTAPQASAEPPIGARAGAVAEVKAPALRRLEFRFEKESWVEVKDADGTVLLSRTNAPGSAQVVEGKAPFILVIGNAAHVSLTDGGTPVDLKPHIALSVAKLKLD